jgi:hypothetical protein
MLLRSLFRNLSLFPPICPFPFFFPLFLPVQHFPSIFFDPFHQFLPLCVLHLVFGFSFPNPPLPSPIFSSSFSYFPVEVPSQEHTFFLVFFHCVFERLLIVFIYLLYIVIISTTYCLYELFSMHPSSFPFSCRSSLIPNFTPVIIPPVALSFFFSHFAPRPSHLYSFGSDFPLCTSFPVSVFFVHYLFIHLLFIPFLAGLSSLLLYFF